MDDRQKKEFKLQKHLRTQHFDKIGAFMLATGGEFDEQLAFGVNIIPVKA